MSDLKKYNIFITITRFSKLLVELFIPLILYDYGFTIKNIILYMIIKYTLCIIMIPITMKINKKISWSKIMILSSFFFSLTYIYLNIMTKSLLSLIILSIIFSIYLNFYWLGRHIYGLSIIEDKKTTDNVSLYTIFTVLGSIPATYIGSLILKYFGFITLTIIVLILMLISIIPLTKINKDIKYIKPNLKPIIKTFSKRNYLFTFIEQFRYILNNIFPLYIYLYIKKEFTYIGITNLICGIGSIIYIFIISKKMDKNKKDYLSITCILLSILYIGKLNINNTNLFYIIVFIEGILKVTLDTIVQRNAYVYGRNYDVNSYIEFTELLNNIFRTIILIIFYLLNLNLRNIIYIGILGIFINSFVKYDDGKYGYKNLLKNDRIKT